MPIFPGDPAIDVPGGTLLLSEEGTIFIVWKEFRLFLIVDRWTPRYVSCVDSEGWGEKESTPSESRNMGKAG